MASEFQRRKVAGVFAAMDVDKAASSNGTTSRPSPPA